MHEVMTMMKRCILFALACAPVGAWAATETHTVVQHRAVFDFVGGKIDLRAACAGQTPLQIELRHTAGDVAAAVFTGMWYTPVHLRVTCATP
jgi:hypothetical protein